MHGNQIKYTIDGPTLSELLVEASFAAGYLGAVTESPLTETLSDSLRQNMTDTAARLRDARNAVIGNAKAEVA